MASNYIVAQFLPDPLSGERINFGVIAYSESGEIRVRFLRHWKRVSDFADGSIDFLKEFAEDAAASLPEQLQTFNSGERADIPLLLKQLGTWHGSIQFTEPRFSLDSPTGVLKSIQNIFLRESARSPKSAFADRSAMLRRTYRAVREVVEARMPEQTEAVLQQNLVVHGRRSDHQFDLALMNAQPRLVVKGISLALSQGKRLRNEIDAAAFSIDDARQKFPDLTILVPAVTPSNAAPHEYDTTRQLVEDLGGIFLAEGAVARWIRREVPKIVDSIAHH